MTFLAFDFFLISDVEGEVFQEERREFTPAPRRA